MDILADILKYAVEFGSMWDGLLGLVVGVKLCLAFCFGKLRRKPPAPPAAAPGPCSWTAELDARRARPALGRTVH